MLIKNFACLLINNTRSKAYIQKLLQHDLVPEYVVYVELQRSAPSTDVCKDPLSVAIQKAYHQRKYFLYSNNPNAIMPVEKRKPELYATFDPDISVLESVIGANIPHTVLQANTLNDVNVVDAVAESDQQYFLFSGGSILRRPILSLPQKLIHVHPGYVPDVRGSMALEWGILTQGRCAASAFFMSEQIDEGDILARRYFDIPKLEYNNIASLYSPHIRSEVILDVVRNYMNTGNFKGEPQDPNEGNTYFKMHPVLNNVVFNICNSTKENK